MKYIFITAWFSDPRVERYKIIITYINTAA